MCRLLLIIVGGVAPSPSHSQKAQDDNNSEGSSIETLEKPMISPAKSDEDIADDSKNCSEITEDA